MVSKRYARANNPRVEGYDPQKPNSHILYLDANNLYGWAMSQNLPTGGFRWVDDCEQLAKTVAEQAADSREGYILEVDMEYPAELQKAHNAYPLAPERMVVPKKWMSVYQNSLLGVGVAPTEVEKLVPNLRNKDRYVPLFASRPGIPARPTAAGAPAGCGPGSRNRLPGWACWRWR